MILLNCPNTPIDNTFLATIVVTKYATIEDNASANSTPNQEDEEKFKDFDEIGSKY